MVVNFLTYKGIRVIQVRKFAPTTRIKLQKGHSPAIAVQNARAGREIKRNSNPLIFHFRLSPPFPSPPVPRESFSVSAERLFFRKKKKSRKYETPAPNNSPCSEPSKHSPASLHSHLLIFFGVLGFRFSRCSNAWKLPRSLISEPWKWVDSDSCGGL